MSDSYDNFTDWKFSSLCGPMPGDSVEEWTKYLSICLTIPEMYGFAKAMGINTQNLDFDEPGTKKQVMEDIASVFAQAHRNKNKTTVKLPKKITSIPPKSSINLGKNSTSVSKIPKKPIYKSTAIADVKRSILKRRQQLGHPSAMATQSNRILNQPEGIYPGVYLATNKTAGFIYNKGNLQRAQRALQTVFKVDVKSKTGLCQDLQSSMYKDELMELAKDLELPVTTKTTKKEICQMIETYVLEANQMITPIQNIGMDEAQLKLDRALIHHDTISAGIGFSLGILDDGTIVGWGDLQYTFNIPLPPKGRRFIAVSAGGVESLGLLDNGAIMGWSNQIEKTKKTTSRSNANFFVKKPEKIGTSKLNRYIAISAGLNHSLALLADGSVIGWGNNSKGQTDIPILEPDRTFIAISAGHEESLALLDNGTVISWGHAKPVPVALQNPPSHNKRCVAISAGGYHMLALLADGTVIGWGFLASGADMVPTVTTPGKKFVAISAGMLHSLGLLDNGVILSWGDNRYGLNQPPTPKPGRRFVGISAGGHHSLALMDDGTVIGWGGENTDIFEERGEAFGAMIAAHGHRFV
eukprot:Pompholyxophrys_sp_v1_NODE_3_length_18401_cov_4.332280.p2 type:complete len:582 gc:universal NODE_3_length_18401_cov_4.332280:15612-13867(-)